MHRGKPGAQSDARTIASPLSGGRGATPRRDTYPKQGPQLRLGAARQRDRAVR